MINLSTGREGENTVIAESIKERQGHEGVLRCHKMQAPQARHSYGFQLHADRRLYFLLSFVAL